MKNSLRAVLVLSLAIFSASAYAADTAAPAATGAVSADNQAINSACAPDAAAAKCGDEVVGGGLLRCLHAYKKANPSYKFTKPCREAMRKRRMDKKGE